MKIIFIGNSWTGKSSFCKKYIENVQVDKKKTIENNSMNQIFHIVNGYLKIQIWEIPSFYESSTISKLSQDAKGVIILCSQPNQNEINKIVRIKEMLDQDIKPLDNSKIPFLLLQNKSDLLTDKEKSLTEKLIQLSKDNQFIGFFQVSAKTGIGINESMNLFLNNIIDKINLWQNKNIINLKKTSKKKYSQCIY